MILLIGALACSLSGHKADSGSARKNLSQVHITNKNRESQISVEIRMAKSRESHTCTYAAGTRHQAHNQPHFHPHDLWRAKKYALQISIARLANKNYCILFRGHHLSLCRKGGKKRAKIYILAVHGTCMCLQVHVCAGCNCYIDGRAFWFVDCVNLEAAKKNIYLHLLIAMCEAINKFCGREEAFYSHSDGGGAMPFKSYSKQ